MIRMETNTYSHTKWRIKIWDSPVQLFALVGHPAILLWTKYTHALVFTRYRLPQNKMDHIPQPEGRDRTFPDVRVYVAPDFVYSKEIPWKEYLDHIGWREEDILGAHESRKSRSEVHRVLQEWFYFGLFSTFTRGDVEAATFIANSPSSSAESFISCTWLWDMVLDWFPNQSNGLNKSTEHVEDVYRFLLYADVTCCSIFKKDADYPDQGLLLSIQLAIDAMRNSLQRSASDIAVPLAQTLGKPRFDAAHTIIRERMSSADWCPSTINVLFSLACINELIFATLLKAPGRDKDHTRCSANACLAYQVNDESKYVTKHVDSGCACEFVFADFTRLSDILSSDGAVPVIEQKEPLRRLDDGRLYVHIAPSRSSPVATTTPYVAISHVWSDGMGNPRDNAIPRCVFERLCSLVSKAHPGAPFWLDTLCFPISEGEAYDNALVRMRQSYEDSHSTLVIDVYLLEQTIVQGLVGEIAVRIMCAPWSRRLWTLQEGMLPPRLMFQFRNCQVDMSWGLGMHIHSFQGFALHKYMKMRGIEELSRLVGRPTTKQLLNPLGARDELVFRSTSNIHDEPLCLGNIMGVDPNVVVRAHVVGDPERTRTERMKAIWASIHDYNASILFWNTPKMQEDGFRWAPLSLMGNDSTSGVTTQRRATLIPGKGLRVKLPAIRLMDSGGESGWPKLLFLRNLRLLMYWTPRDEQQPWPASRNLVILLGAELPAHEDAYDPSAILTTLTGKVAEIGQSFATEDGTVLQRLQSLGVVRMHPFDKELAAVVSDSRPTDLDFWRRHDRMAIIMGRYVGELEGCVD